jgi:hypothetical protein
LKGYDLCEMAISDWTTGINTAYEKRVIEAAKNLLKKGLP